MPLLTFKMYKVCFCFVFVSFCGYQSCGFRYQKGYNVCYVVSLFFFLSSGVLE